MQFDLVNPTRIVFGSGKIARLDDLVPASARVLLFYGGGSIKRNGVYDQVTQALGTRIVAEFGGIEVNPHYETILEACDVVRRNDIGLILSVGGGSVADAAKFLASAAMITGADPWDELMAGRYPEKILPVGVVLTLPATGSESNAVSVISHQGRRIKYPFANEAARPRFAILDPDTLVSLDRRQRANGAVDAVTHVLEQYLTVPANTPVQYGYSESLLEVLFEWGPKFVQDNSAEARENVMWAANQALNGLIGAGVRQDWSTHYIGHAITALYDIDHARSLTLIMGSVQRFRLAAKTAMLARYGRRVWKIEEADDTIAAGLAIKRTEAFFREMGCPTRLSEVEGVAFSADDIVAHLERAGQTRLGENEDIGPAEVRKILELAA
ncbi:MAG: iron-containing alcohol dehydrogenase [Hyphomicrobiaceae bacterium]|nr:iron-containing alcohol dehydrogenase [Hyphomicrobiaceae bacterium]